MPSVLPLTVLIGPSGAGHEALGQALMRLPEVLPMTLVQEQSFVHLWWANSGKAVDADAAPDAAVLASAAETLRDWAAAARASGRRLAFGARACLRATPKDGGDCSWISGMGAQLEATQLMSSHLLEWRQLEWAGEPFAYPFAFDPAADPGSQRAHYPRLADLRALCAASSPPIDLRVLALRRSAISALAHAAAERPAPFWKGAGREGRLAHLAAQIVDGGRRAAAQLRELEPEQVTIPFRFLQISHRSLQIPLRFPFRFPFRFLKIPSTPGRYALSTSMRC